MIYFNYENSDDRIPNKKSKISMMTLRKIPRMPNSGPTGAGAGVESVPSVLFVFPSVLFVGMSSLEPESSLVEFVFPSVLFVGMSSLESESSLVVEFVFPSVKCANPSAVKGK